MIMQDIGAHTSSGGLDIGFPTFFRRLEQTISHARVRSTDLLFALDELDHIPYEDDDWLSDGNPDTDHDLVDLVLEDTTN